MAQYGFVLKEVACIELPRASADSSGTCTDMWWDLQAIIPNIYRLNQSWRYERC